MNQTPRPAIVRDEHLEYLANLRRLGTVNMFGAWPYLAETFGLPESDARAIFKYWAQTFSEIKE